LDIEIWDRGGGIGRVSLANGGRADIVFVFEYGGRWDDRVGAWTEGCLDFLKKKINKRVAGILLKALGLDEGWRCDLLM